MSKQPDEQDRGDPARSAGKAAASPVLGGIEALRTVFDAANDAIYVLRIEDGLPGRFVEVNQTAVRRLGYSRQEYLQMRPADIYAPEAAPDIPDIMERLLSTRGATFETVHVARDGRQIPVQISSRWCSLQGRPHAVSVARDISAQKEAESELKKSRWELALQNRIADLFLTTTGDEMFSRVLDIVLEALESPYGYFGYIDDAGDLVCPSMTLGILDRCEVPGKSCVFPRALWGGLWGRSLDEATTLAKNEELVLPEGHLKLACALAVPILLEKHLIGQFVVADRTGGYGDEEARLLETIAARVAPVLQAYLDRKTYEKEREQTLAERVRMETQMQQVQRLESIGALAGGIAHDFNNVLFPLIVYTEMCLDDAPPGTELRSNLEEILYSANRARDLVQQILAFSRPGKPEPGKIELQTVVKESLKLSRSSLPATIAIRREIDPDCGAVLADATEMHQVCMNLITNAYHAMQETGGTLSVRLQQERIDDRRSAALVAPGDYVCLSVADTGAGIEPALMERIFDPYFTTKEKGKGTGLGLSIVQGIAKRWKGGVAVTSEPSRGTEFRVYLPAYSEAAPRQEKPEPDPIPKGNREHILLVDDEEPVVRMLMQMLQRLGYEVAPFTSSTEALSAFSRDPAKFDLVITDTTMPELTGDRLAEKMIAVRPDLPVIICTGFSEKIGDERARRIGIRDFLLKPVVRSELAQKIRSALKDKPPLPPESSASSTPQDP